MKIKKTNRAKLLEKLIRMVWASLESHLEWTHAKSSEGQKFHIDCTAEYAEMIKILTDLY